LNLEGIATASEDFTEELEPTHFDGLTITFKITGDFGALLKPTINCVSCKSSAEEEEEVETYW